VARHWIASPRSQGRSQIAALRRARRCFQFLSEAD
jgi:hypothetical protein